MEKHTNALWAVRGFLKGLTINWDQTVYMSIRQYNEILKFIDDKLDVDEISKTSQKT